MTQQKLGVISVGVLAVFVVVLVILAARAPGSGGPTGDGVPVTVTESASPVRNPLEIETVAPATFPAPSGSPTVALSSNVTGVLFADAGLVPDSVNVGAAALVTDSVGASSNDVTLGASSTLTVPALWPTSVAVSNEATELTVFAPLFQSRV